MVNYPLEIVMDKVVKSRLSLVLEGAH